MSVAIVTLYTYAPHNKLPLKMLLVGELQHAQLAITCEF